MKVLILLLSITIAVAQVPADVKGYKNLKWGDTTQTFTSIYTTAQETADVSGNADNISSKDLRVFTTTSSTMITESQFSFYRDRLYKVCLTINADNLKEVLAKLKSQYGYPGKNEQFNNAIGNNFGTGTILYWEFKSTTIKMVGIDIKNFNGYILKSEVYLTYWSTAIEQQIAADKLANVEGL